MHSKHHEGGVYQVKEGKTYEVTQDKCLADGHVEMSEKNDGVYNNSGDYAQNNAGRAPTSFT